MQKTSAAAAEFLSHQRIAVTGVSRETKSHGSNVVYLRLRDRGYEVFAVNPNAEEVEGDRCYPDLASIPGGAVDGVVIGTRPERAEDTVRECARLGIGRVWMHRGPGGGKRLGGPRPSTGAPMASRSSTAAARACTAPPPTAGHKAMRAVFTLTGNVPRSV